MSPMDFVRYKVCVCVWTLLSASKQTVTSVTALSHSSDHRHTHSHTRRCLWASFLQWDRCNRNPLSRISQPIKRYSFPRISITPTITVANYLLMANCRRARRCFCRWRKIYSYSLIHQAYIIMTYGLMRGNIIIYYMETMGQSWFSGYRVVMRWHNLSIVPTLFSWAWTILVPRIKPYSML